MLKYNIIPKPNCYTQKEGSYVISSKTSVLCSQEFVTVGNYLTSYLKTVPEDNEGAVKIRKTAGMERDAYSLVISADGVVITASEINGAFYGAVTLKMILMQAEKKDGKAILNYLVINDKPAYDFRGLMLDSSRYYFDVDTIKNLLDNMAFLKLNKFHWHLSDDQGYRIESKVYPKHNEIGSRRKHAHLKNHSDEDKEYFYFYTQQEIKDIVQYAADLHIDVIPEIDLPGHTMAFLAAYPEYACNNISYEVMTTNGVSPAIMCGGNTEIYEFLDKLFDEICPLFPYSKFHIGGDEAFLGYKIWNKCEKCQAVMRENNLKEEKDLQTYFMSKVNEILKKYNKTAISWDDCIDDSFDPSVSCQLWQTKSIKQVRSQAMKRDIILSPSNYFYFDVKYSHIPLKKTYSFNNVKVGLGKSGYRISGVECELWSEWIDSADALEFSTYPRVAAFAEVSWTELCNRNYKDFYKRLDWYKTYMNVKNINYSRVEKRKFGTGTKGNYHLGTEGLEYKKSMELKKDE